MSFWLIVCLFLFMSLQGMGQKRRAYDILIQTDSSIHYFIHLPKADSTGQFYDTLIHLPPSSHQYRYLSFQSGGSSSHIILCHDADVLPQFWEGRKCEQDPLLPAHYHHACTVMDDREEKLDMTQLGLKGTYYIHYQSCGYYGYYRILIP